MDSLLNLNQGKAWVGFTGATGAERESHDILNWHFNDSGAPIINSQRIQSLAVPLCDSVGYDTLYARNVGDTTLSVSSASFTQGGKGYSVVSPNSYPFTIAPGDSAAFIVRFAPPAQGTFNDTLLLYSNDTVPGHDPWRIAFAGAHNAVALAALPLNFGNLTASGFPATETLTVTNTGSLPITITAGYFNGLSPFIIVSGIPVTIQPGNSAPIVIRFDDPGTDSIYSDTMHFIFSPECAPFSALITGSRGNTPPVIQTSVQSVTNGLGCGTSAFDTIFIRNGGGEPLTLSSAHFVAGTEGFSLVAPAAFPVAVPPNDSAMFIVQFVPPGPGMYGDTLLVANNDTLPGHNPWRIAFSGSKDTEQYAGTLSTTTAQAKPGDTIVVPVILQSPDSARDVRLTMRIRYNASILLPLSAAGGAIDSIGMGFAIFTSDGMNTTDTIGWIKFIVALGDSVFSPIAFDTLLSGGCPVTFSQTSGGVQLIGLCQQGGTRLFADSGAISLAQNTPNPFNGETDIAFSTIETGETRLTVSNMLGETVFVLADASFTPGKHTIHFDASSLCSGMYYYTLQSPTQSLRREMIVEK